MLQDLKYVFILKKTKFMRYNIKYYCCCVVHNVKEVKHNLQVNVFIINLHTCILTFF